MCVSNTVAFIKCTLGVILHIFLVYVAVFVPTFFITELSSSINVLNILHIPSSFIFNDNHFDKTSDLNVECFITMPSTLFQSTLSIALLNLGASDGNDMICNPVNFIISATVCPIALFSTAIKNLVNSPFCFKKFISAPISAVFPDPTPSAMIDLLDAYMNAVPTVW